MAFEGRIVVPLHEGDHRLSYAPGDGDVLVISFASLGQRRRRMPKDEFVRSVLAQGRVHALFVSDRRRSWLTSRDLVTDLCATVETLRRVDGVRRIVTLGASMGGYSALAAAGLFGVDAALAISPQYSVNKDEVPWETRWRFWRRRIGDIAPVSLSPLPAGGWYSVFHAVPDDERQAAGFAPQPGLDHYLLPGLRHHEVAAHLGANGGVRRLLRAKIAGDRAAMAALAGAAGASRV